MKRNNVNIAITGGIGSGKSTVANFIRSKGYNVISCDEIYARLLENPEFLKSICYEFGDVLTSEGKLNREKLSKTVFGDKQKLAALNKLTHGKIMEKAFSECVEKINYVEVPLLFENGYERLFDETIVILREEEARINCIVERNNITAEQAKNRLNSQFNYNNCDFAEYYVIHNNLTLSELKQKTNEVLEKITVKYL